MDKNNQIQNNGNGPKMNMPRFNMNWIYIIAILALGLLFLQWRSAEQQHCQDGHLLRLQDYGQSWLCLENRRE